MRFTTLCVLLTLIISGCQWIDPDLTGDSDAADRAVSSTYYVDSNGGSDSNTGTTIDSPWKTLTKLQTVTFQPGAAIYLKSGSVWTMASGSEFHPLGSGSSGNPIIIDMYGGTTKPVINGNGAKTSNALHLSNQEYWEINNLEITNAGAVSDNNGPDSNKKRAVSIEATSGVKHHIYLKNLNVHNVYGSLGTEAGGKDNGGIVMICSGGSSSHFDDILIDGCTVTNVDRQGITVGDILCNGGLTNYSNANYSTNVVIQNCVVDHPGGDGIVTFYTEGAIVQHCLSINSNNKSDYACSMWPWSCSNTHFQYNEGYGAQVLKDGTVDDGTFGDADGENINTYYDYNYTHDNVGGGFMLCASTGSGSLPPKNTYIRYNISRNEGNYWVYFSSAASATGNYFYNNTVYQPSGSNKLGMIYADSGKPAFTAKNNVFVNLSSVKGFNAGSGTHTLDYNVYYGSGFSSDTTEINKDSHKLTTDPLLVGASSATINTRYSDVINNGVFKLASGSPAIASGIVISGNPTKDFWGSTVSTTAPCRGAHEYSGVAPVAVSISPTSASILVNATQQFTATVTGTTNTSVTWSVTGGGSVSSSGLFTAPSSAASCTVKATSVADTTKSASAVVTVSATPTVSVSISPTSASVTTGSTQQFTATVTGSSNTSVTWSVTGGGSVSSSGLFTAPSAAASCTVKATSVADTTKSASAVVTVTASGSDTNIAPSGTGYIWTGGSSATSNTTRAAKTGVNDNNLTTSIVLKAAGEQSKWESAGVIWSSTKTVSSVVFINGTDDGYDNGYWESGIDVQVSTNGTTWTSAGWTISPAYPYNSSAYGQTYTFTGAVKSGIKGIRVVGKTGTGSWSGAVIEVQAIGH